MRALWLTCAGVAMRDLVSACTVTRNSTGGTGTDATTLLLDPGAKEEAEADAGVTLAYMRTVGAATQVVATGTWDGDTLDDAVQLAAQLAVQLAGQPAAAQLAVQLAVQLAAQRAPAAARG